MNVESNDVLALRAADPPGLQRALRASFLVHLVAVLLLVVVPREWLSSQPVEPIRMTISLGGGIGARTSGMTSAGGRTVEEVAPPPPRPQPIRPATAPDNRMTIPERTVDRPPPPKTETKAPPAPTVRPPAPGQQVARGSTTVETGNVGQSTGLASGGDAAGQRTEFDADFCCPQWGQALVAAIDQRWAKVQAERGVTVVSFVLLQNGTIKDGTLKVDVTSGSTNLDRLAIFAVRQAGIPPLPRDYTEPELRVRLRFPYGVQ